jgi:preprotein translocase SecE subunit
MARTRQKAKQRQAKRREQQRNAQGTTGQKPPSNPAEQAVVDQAQAYEVGDALEESGGDVAEAEERLEREASDEAISPIEAPPAVEASPARTATKTRERKERKPRPAEERGDGRARSGRRGAGRGAAAAGQVRPARRREARQRGRVVGFFIQVWAELRRVQWPDRTQVTQATAVVIVFCILAGLYLAFFDYIFAKLVKLIL